MLTAVIKLLTASSVTLVDLEPQVAIPVSVPATAQAVATRPRRQLLDQRPLIVPSVMLVDLEILLAQQANARVAVRQVASPQQRQPLDLQPPTVSTA